MLEMITLYWYDFVFIFFLKCISYLKILWTYLTQMAFGFTSSKFLFKRSVFIKFKAFSTSVAIASSQCLFFSYTSRIGQNHNWNDSEAFTAAEANLRSTKQTPGTLWQGLEKTYFLSFFNFERSQTACQCLLQSLIIALLSNYFIV